MLILALDTSGDVCSLAVARVEAAANTGTARILAEYNFRHERHLTERLPEILTFVLRDAGTSLAAVDAFAVGLGPGSFTGVRVGVTLAKTFGMALSKPVVGVSSLDAIAEPYHPVRIRPLVAAVPTRRTESIVSIYVDGPVPLAPPEVVVNSHLITWVETIAGITPPLTLLGEAAPAIYQALIEAGHPAENLTVQVAAATAAAVARLAAPRLLNGDFDDVDSLVPLYVAPTPVG